MCIKFDIYGFIALPPRERQPAASYKQSSAKSDCVSSAARQKFTKGTSWSWSYGRLIYNYICNHCLSPLKLWVRIAIMARFTRYNIMWQSLSVTYDRSWFSPVISVNARKNCPPKYSWNIVESGVKCHNPTPTKMCKPYLSYFLIIIHRRIHVPTFCLHYFLFVNMFSSWRRQ